MKKGDRKAQVLKAVALFNVNNGYPPSYRDLGEYVGIAHSAVHRLVQELRTDGLIHERNTKTSRTITLTHAGSAAATDELTGWRDYPG